MSGFDLIKNVTVTTWFNNVRDIKWERVLKLVTVMKFVYFIKKEILLKFSIFLMKLTILYGTTVDSV